MRDAIEVAMRVLLIEDDSAVSQSLILLLRADAMCADAADCGPGITTMT